MRIQHVPFKDNDTISCFGGENVEEIMDQGMAHEDVVVCLNFAQLLFLKHKKNLIIG